MQGVEALRGIDDALAANQEIAHEARPFGRAYKRSAFCALSKRLRRTQAASAHDENLRRGLADFGTLGHYRVGMESVVATELGAYDRQRGFTIVEVMVVVAVLTMMLLAVGVAGAKRHQTHPAGLALQAAFAEARALAMSTGNAADSVVPTGATVSIAPDALAKSGHGSIIRVYRSRPIVYTGVGPGRGTAATPLVQDVGFPTARVGASIRLTQTSGATIATPMTILVSQSGYTSIIGGYAYDPANARTFRTDPGCDERGVTITTDDGSPHTETYPFTCRDAVLSVDHPVIPYGT